MDPPATYELLKPLDYALPPRAAPSSATAAPAGNALMTRPQHFASFSYGPGRELLLDADRRDRSLRWYRQPVLGLDLRYGFERCTWRPDDLDEGLDGLLECLLHTAKTPKTSQAIEDMLAKTSVITWRGMLTRLLTCTYEENEGWEMNAMMLNGCLYLEDNKAAGAGSDSSAKRQKTPQDGPQKLQTYFGYAFESFSTSDVPHPSPASTPERCWSGDVDTNVQWASVVRTSLGGIPIIIGGEVDCVQEGAGVDAGGGLETSAFIELKTNMVIESPRDEMRFERYKLLKHYVQSILLGTPSIIIGFRQNNGILAGIQSFETQDIPSLVAGKPHAWHALACFNSGQAILKFLLDTLKSSQAIRAYEEMPDNYPAPVFRITFKPADSSTTSSRASLSVRQLSQSEVTDVQSCKANNREPRIGFLLERWVDLVQSVRARSSTAQGNNSNHLNY